jgi:hypothetical protein
MAEAAVLLPVRVETRFDEPDGFAGARLRVLVVPDVCWYDRHQPASQAELDLLAEAVAAAGGPLVTGAPSTPEAAAAFDALAAKVGPGRALWLARTSPTEAGRDGAQGTRIHGLPERLELYAALGDGPGAPIPAFLGMTTNATAKELLVTPSPDVDGGWWPSWSALEDAGLTFTVDLGVPPGPIAPADITALYVVGLGEADTADTLRAHLDAGQLGVLHAGLPTNTIAGTPTADLGADPAAWRALGERDTFGEEDLLARSLTGDPTSLGPLVGSSPDSLGDHAARVVIPALWPALRGHAVTEIWGTGARLVAGAESQWASENLRPDGPLPLLRIGDQPYGVWPVSDWERWEPDDGGEPAEGGDPDVRMAVRVRDLAAERARSGLGTVVGADAAKLWDLLAQTPTSDAYEVRPGLKFSTLRKFFVGSPEAAAADEWLRRVESVAADDAHLADVLVTVGGPLPLRMNVIVPEIAFAPSGAPMFQPSPDVSVGQARQFILREPNRWVGAAFEWFEAMFQRQGLDGNAWERMSSHWVERWPASILWRLVVVSGLVALQRAVRATNPAFDASDPLVPGVFVGIPPGASGPEVSAYQRFRMGVGRTRQLVEDTEVELDRIVPELDRFVRGLLDTASHRVDPWLTGAASRRLGNVEGPRPVGLYGWVDAPDLGVPGPDTEIGVLLAPSDAQARTAVVLRDKSHFDSNDLWHLDLTSASVRDASRLADDVRTGAHPAEALGREVERVVGERIKVDELRAAFPVRTEHAGRRTCDGIAVLAAATAEPPDPRLAAAGLQDADVERVASLATTVDAYADLLVADAAQHALAGRAEAAAHALDAAAGLALPPPLDVLATPRSGRSLRTTVLAALPAAPEAAADEASPVAIASPALAAWLAAASGAPAGPAWTWQVSDGGTETEVTLADLGLVQADAVAVTPEALAALAAATVSPTATAVSPTGPALVRRLAETFGARPVAGADLGLAPEDTPAYETPVRQALADRVAALRAGAAALAQRLRDAADDAEREHALLQAARWGVVPGTDATAAADLLEERVDAAPPAVDATFDLAQLTILIRDLAAPAATVPVLGAATGEALTAAVGPLTAEPNLDEVWLELVAAVRPALARVEAHQALARAHGAPQLTAVTNHPGDPWLIGAPVEGPGNRNVPHLVVTYGPEAPPPAGDVALGVLDGWAEVVPDERHTAGAAFRFNAPGARAPQAFLVAVTPVRGEDLTTEGVLATVAQARATAHARTARAEDLGNLDVLAAGILPAFEQGGLQYEVPATLKDWV